MYRRSFLIGVIGNILEHYDMALFGLLAPFIAPLFFHALDPISALVMTYAMIPLGMLTRPLGALFFGWIADQYGRLVALCGSLVGMAMATVSIGCLPTSDEIGIFSPIFLAIIRLFQSFFAAGETVGGAIYVLEQADLSKRSLMSSFFDASTIGGILIASFFVTFLSERNWIKIGWRYLFWMGGVTAFIGIFLRLKTKRPQDPIRIAKMQIFKEMYVHRWAFLAIVFASGFSYTTYSLAFTFMNGYIPLVTTLTKVDVMKMNTALLGFELILLPIFGWIANKFGKEKVMLFGVIVLCVFALPLFASLGSSSTLFFVVILRLMIVFSGLAFAAPYHAWAMEQVPSCCRATLLCFGYTLGSQVIGTPTASFCIFAYKQTGWVGSPVLYLFPIALGALFSLWITRRQKALQSL